MTENERNIIKELATSEPVVRNLVLLWDLYMNTNHTGVDASNMTDWKEFLEEEREFVESFDFLKDLAIDNPGLYFVLVCTLLNVWFIKRCQSRESQSKGLDI